MPFMVSIDDELHIPALGMWLDARRPRALAFVSHAHTDHIGRHAAVIATAPTAALLSHRLRLRDGRVTVRGFFEPFSMGGAEMELVPAGHVLGSAQLLVRRDGRTLAYTGDFKLRPGRTHERAVVPRADTIVMECTYGRPHYRFPARADVEAELTARCADALTRGMTPVVYAYSLGKAQEVVAVLTAAGLPVMVHGAIADVCDIYARHGVELGGYERYARGTHAGKVLVVPNEARRKSMIRAIFPRYDLAVTGWAVDSGTRHRMGVDAALPLSDHADFPELLEYVERSGAAKVWCLHGFRDFVQHLRRVGVDASWLAPNAQLELFR